MSILVHKSEISVTSSPLLGLGVTLGERRGGGIRKATLRYYEVLAAPWRERLPLIIHQEPALGDRTAAASGEEQLLMGTLSQEGSQPATSLPSAKWPKSPIYFAVNPTYHSTSPDRPCSTNETQSYKF